MTSTTRRAAWAGVALVLVAVTFWSITGAEPRAPTSTGPVEAATPDAGSRVAEVLEDPSAQADALETNEPAPVATVPAETPAKTREYALGLHELRGLPETVAPGTTFELWATWEPPVVDEPYAGKLVPKVVVVKVIPPITPEGPTSVIVSIPLKYMRDFTYAHRWGTLSVALL
ncbi:MAG: hypothetical protein ACR2KQ_05215 [Actinomycetota bacterium]